jgi:hypothetical protein
MRTAAKYLLIALVLGAAAGTSAMLGYWEGLAVSTSGIPTSSVLPVHSASDQARWQYQTYDCGKKSDSFANSRKISEVVNSYAAKGFEPCSPPTGIFPDGVESDRLIWFRRESNPFLPSISPITENTAKTLDN